MYVTMLLGGSISPSTELLMVKHQHFAEASRFLAGSLALAPVRQVILVAEPVEEPSSLEISSESIGMSILQELWLGVLLAGIFLQRSRVHE